MCADGFYAGLADSDYISVYVCMICPLWSLILFLVLHWIVFSVIYVDSVICGNSETLFLSSIYDYQLCTGF